MRGGAADTDEFVAGGEGAGAVFGGVMGVVDLALDEDVLGIGMRGGEAPGEAVIAADDDHRHAGAGGAGAELAAGEFDAGEVPEDGGGKAQMRV